jgi:hypothetical protein
MTIDLLEFAARQRPVLEDWMTRTTDDAKLAEHHDYYRDALADLDRNR